MKLGLSTLLFSEGTPKDGIELASKLDLDSVEIILDMPHFPLDPKSELLKEIRELTISTGLRVRTHGRFLDLNPVSLYSEMRELSLKQTLESIEACNSMNGEMVTVHPGRCWFRRNKELFQKCRKWFQDYLKKASTFAQERGITLAVETGSHNADYPGSPEELSKAVKKRKKVGITLDVGHLNLSAQRREEKEEDWILDSIKSVEDRLVNVHLHDNTGISDDHLPPGQGKINFSPIMKALNRFYEGPIILELWDLNNPFKDIKKSIEYIKAL